MAVINILDKHTQELIAAGEVVERPSSVAKELMENAIDAGATSITVSILQGGISMLEVSDNGSGIESEYIEKAFIRHATSKIKCGEDLFNISTLGFRGEALPSIASVARVTVLTRTVQDEFASAFTVEGGENGTLLPGARAVGTTITVRDLFYNTPARMKFLKKDATEAAYVAEVVVRTAVSHPEISFEFVKDGKTVFNTAGDCSLKGAVSVAINKQFAAGLIPVQSSSGIYKVSGMVTSPSACRASRSMQFFYLNGRYIKNKTIMAALENAYKGTLMQGKFPGCVLFLEAPPQLVDVNVHPSKIEVRFSRESDVFEAVYAAVKASLAVPQHTEKFLTFDAQNFGSESNSTTGNDLGESVSKTASGTIAALSVRMVIPPSSPIPTAPVMSADLTHELHSERTPYYSETHNESERQLDISPEEVFHEKPSAEALTGAKPSETLPAQNQPAIDSVQQLPLCEKLEEKSLIYIGEVFQTYIVAQYDKELCLIDKHAAHERILYEKIASSYGNVASQMLISPISVDLSAAEKAAILDNLSLLSDVGLEVDDFGGSAVLLRAVPADVNLQNLPNLVIEIAQRLVSGSKDAINERTEWVMHSVACRAAMKAGDRSNAMSLLSVAEKVLKNEIPPFCPHGRPVVLRITQKEIEKQFGRIV